MALLRSIFWLGIAFMVIGPQLDYAGSASTVSNELIVSGQQMLQQHTDLRTCDSIECIGARVTLSAGVQTLNNVTHSMGELVLPTPMLISPSPHPRIVRHS